MKINSMDHTNILVKAKLTWFEDPDLPLGLQICAACSNRTI